MPKTKKKAQLREMITIDVMNFKIRKHCRKTIIFEIFDEIQELLKNLPKEYLFDPQSSSIVIEDRSLYRKCKYFQLCSSYSCLWQKLRQLLTNVIIPGNQREDYAHCKL